MNKGEGKCALVVSAPGPGWGLAMDPVGVDKGAGNDTIPTKKLEKAAKKKAISETRSQ